MSLGARPRHSLRQLLATSESLCPANGRRESPLKEVKKHCLVGGGRGSWGGFLREVVQNPRYIYYSGCKYDWLVGGGSLLDGSVSEPPVYQLLSL